MILTNDLADLQSRVQRHRIVLGTTEIGDPFP